MHQCISLNDILKCFYQITDFWTEGNLSLIRNKMYIQRVGLFCGMLHGNQGRQVTN